VSGVLKEKKKTVKPFGSAVYFIKV